MCIRSWIEAIVSKGSRSSAFVCDVHLGCEILFIMEYLLYPNLEFLIFIGAFCNASRLDMPANISGGGLVWSFSIVD